MTPRIPTLAASEWALFLDIDGTLLDLAPEPDLVTVPADLPALLDRLTIRFGGALSLVSGRTLDSIDRLFPGGRDAVGCHGAEWRMADKTSPRPSEVPFAVTAPLAAAVARRKGLVMETKGVALAIHFREAPELAEEVRELAAAAITGAPAPLRLQEGKSVIEIVPAQCSKGGAIATFMRQPPYQDRRPIFVGDDLTDESGFETVNGLGGLAIHIGNAPWTAAGFRLSSPIALRRWLSTLEKDG